MKQVAKRVVPALAGFLLVVGMVYVATIPSIAAGHQAVQFSYQRDVLKGRDSCGKASETFEGDALIGGEWLSRGGMSVAWCWRLVQGPLAVDHVVGTPTVNTWAETRFGWDYQGISSRVRGHGTSCYNGHCWEYYYYRYYFRFTRGTKLLQQTCTVFVTITVRGNGTYAAGHTDGGIC